MNCSYCRAPLENRARYEVKHFNVRGEEALTANTCSLICLLRWASETATVRGAMLAGKVQGAVGDVWRTLRGPKR